MERGDRAAGARVSWRWVPSSSALLLASTLGGCAANCPVLEPPVTPAAAGASVPLAPQAPVSPRPAEPRLAAETYARYADALESHLNNNILNAWYPRLLDTKAGGFGPISGPDWTPLANHKFIVFQSRMTWVAAQAAAMSSPRRQEFLGYVKHGLTLLDGVLWDKKSGGFFWQVGADHQPKILEKHTYGESFGIYAAAAAARVAGEKAGLELATRAFHWLDQHAHDAENGGYYEALTREGSPVLAAHPERPNDLIGTPYGCKSMNTHIHLLEAFTELYRAGKDSAVKQRLEELFAIVRDRIAAPDGYLYLYFNPEWKPIPSEDSYGHDLETAFLLLDAAESLGMPADPATHKLSRRLVDRALEHGWDSLRGGLADAGPPEGKAERLDKVWWTQAEALNALLLMHELYGKETNKYFEAFVSEWRFIETFVADRVYGDWFWSVTTEGASADPKREKGGVWKDPYHQGRAVMDCVERLRKLAQAGLEQQAARAQR